MKVLFGSSFKGEIARYTSFANALAVKNIDIGIISGNVHDFLDVSNHKIFDTNEARSYIRNYMVNAEIFKQDRNLATGLFLVQSIGYDEIAIGYCKYLGVIFEHKLNEILTIFTASNRNILFFLNSKINLPDQVSSNLRNIYNKILYFNDFVFIGLFFENSNNKEWLYEIIRKIDRKVKMAIFITYGHYAYQYDDGDAVNRKNVFEDSNSVIKNICDSLSIKHSIFHTTEGLDCSLISGIHKVSYKIAENKLIYCNY